jgi:3-isopropylmalate/(R)-2-methylmalate dehydratase large subunit
MVLTSMSIQMGAKFGYIAPDQKVFDFLEQSGQHDYIPEFTDGDYVYRDVYEVNLEDIPPLIAFPHGFDEIIPVGEASRIPIDQAVIGSCTGGRIEDFRTAADVLRGRHIAPGVRLIMTTGSREIFAQAVEEGTILPLIQAGAAINVSRCGPCGSACDGFLAPGEVCLTNANRNFKGRLGSPQAFIYLASTHTVALSALRGYIADPWSE